MNFKEISDTLFTTCNMQNRNQTLKALPFKQTDSLCCGINWAITKGGMIIVDDCVIRRRALVSVLTRKT